jgi:asparagine synthase (glutamine-hydrolysing)
MCGINGIVNFKGTEKAKQLVQQMNACLSHRGPDNDGVFAVEGVVLGHRRLSIIDLSSAGNQPMFSADGRYALVYNGELYNYQALKFDLQRAESGAGKAAYLFKTDSDTEVILAAYARWGKECLRLFNGMYAMAIWDEQEKELFIARDRMGIKPLYYSQAGDALIFSSEIRAVMESGLVKRKLDREALADYLRYQTVHAPSTIIQNVKMLLPGHYMTVKGRDIAIKRYWSPKVKENKGLTYQKTCEKVNELFHASVERRLIADVPFGAFLSGGIDSSAVVAAMSKVSSSRVETFSVTFDESEFSEAKYARLIAEKFMTDHHEIRLKPGDFLEELPRSLKAMDHPSGDGPNTYVVSKATKAAGITMALSGLGGDELFAGYDVFKRMAGLGAKKWLNLLPGFSKKTGGALLRTLKPGAASEKKNALLRLKKINFTSAYPLTRQVLLDDTLNKLLGSGLAPNEVEKIISGLESIGPDHILSKVSIAEITTYMQNVLLRDADQMSMAHALEVRVPFLDHELVEFVLSVPDRFKYPSTPKKLLIDAMGDALPREIVDRPKMGFTLPFKTWMKKELHSFCEERMHALAGRDLFVKAEVIKLWEQFLKDDPRVSWSRIWYLVVLEDWLQKNDIHE